MCVCVFMCVCVCMCVCICVTTTVTCVHGYKSAQIPEEDVLFRVFLRELPLVGVG